MIFFSLLSTALSSVFYGIIITAVIMVVIYVILKAMGNGIVETPVFYVTGAVLAVLLVIQSSLLIGSLQARDAADAAELYLNQLLEDRIGIVGANDSQKVMDAVTERFPVIGSFIDIADFSGHDISELASSMHATMIDYLTSYAWCRVWWMLGIIAVACVVVVMYGKPERAVATRRSAFSSSRQRVGTDSHQRVSRRHRR